MGDMDRLTMMRLFSEFEEFDEGDFTPEELEAYLAFREEGGDAVSPYEWKEKYFMYYDDVKDHTRKKQDW